MSTDESLGTAWMKQLLQTEEIVKSFTGCVVCGAEWVKEPLDKTFTIFQLQGDWKPLAIACQRCDVGVGERARDPIPELCAARQREIDDENRRFNSGGIR